ncbi:MAG: porin family protein [Chitinophagaceae bacterium]
MKYTISCLALLLTVVLNAQTPVDKEWHFGAKGDLNLTNISGNGMKNGYTTGFQIGGYAEKKFNSHWSVQPELLFSQNNAKVDVTDFLKYYVNGNTYASNNIKLGYISVPIIFKYHINPYFSFVAGPQYSQMLFDAESLMVNPENKGVAFKRYDVSINGGAEAYIGSVTLYARYNKGLVNINNIDDRYSWMSQHIQLGVAVKIK